MGEQIDEATFVRVYGDIETGHMLGEQKLKLASLLAFEAIGCQAPNEKRLDPQARMRWLANIVGDQLRPEHQYLLAEAET